MKEEMALNIPTAKLDELRCFVCRGYLSSSPIQLLPNGLCICGHCSAFNCNTAVPRVLQLEAILREVIFPCQFMKNGCTEKVLFGFATEHESTCDHRTFGCPSLNFCSWRGLGSQFQDHFGYKHPDLIKKNVGFQFQVGQDAEEVFAFIYEGLFLIFKYYYNSNKKVLKYDIRCLKAEYIVYQLQLMNGSGSCCSFDLQWINCLRFENSFYEMQSAVTLYINNFLENLLFPGSVRVAINLKVIPCNNGEKQFTKAKSVLNYHLLELVRCRKCLKYLVFPIFQVTIGTVCYECAKSFRFALPSFNRKLKDLVATLNYPCQWYGCDFIGNSTEIKTHRVSCHFRSYKCFVSFCSANLTLTSVANHLKEKHKNAEYSRHYVYKTSFLNPYVKKYAFTVKDDVLLTFRHSLIFNKFYQEQEHSILLFSDLSDIAISIQFEHAHCKLKSKPFYLVSNRKKIIKLNELPACFERDELSVIICRPKMEIVVKPIRQWWLLLVAMIVLLGSIMLYYY